MGYHGNKSQRWYLLTARWRIKYQYVKQMFCHCFVTKTIMHTGMTQPRPHWRKFMEESSGFCPPLWRSSSTRRRKPESVLRYLFLHTNLSVYGILIFVTFGFSFFFLCPPQYSSIGATMSFNSSFLPPPHHPQTNSSHSPPVMRCFNSRLSFLIFTAFAVTNILVLLPICTFVLYLGLQRWRKRFSAPAAASLSHADAITYHMIIVEMLGVLGCGLFCCGACFGLMKLMRVGLFLYSINAEGHTSFHILSCVDRYLAVVHPITYLGLKQRSGVMMRNVTVGSAWLVFAIFAVISQVFYSSTSGLCFLLFSTLIISYCCLCVLHSLVRPGPGAGGRVNQSKKKALHTIMAIMGALMWRFGGYLSVSVTHSFSALSEDVRCAVLLSGVWFSLPSSLVLPLLCLHRAGKLG